MVRFCDHDLESAGIVICPVDNGQPYPESTSASPVVQGKVSRLSSREKSGYSLYSLIQNSGMRNGGKTKWEPFLFEKAPTRHPNDRSRKERQAIVILVGCLNRVSPALLTWFPSCSALATFPIRNPCPGSLSVSTTLAELMNLELRPKSIHPCGFMQ